jgi:hypothetical protein
VQHIPPSGVGNRGADSKTAAFSTATPALHVVGWSVFYRAEKNVFVFKTD